MYSTPSRSRGLRQAACTSSVLVVCPPMATGNFARRFGDDRLCHLQPLVEGHRRKIAGGAAGQQHAIFFVDAAPLQELHMPAYRRQIQLQIGIAKHRGYRDVAAFETFLGAHYIHASVAFPLPIRPRDRTRGYAATMANEQPGAVDRNGLKIDNSSHPNAEMDAARLSLQRILSITVQARC